MRLPENIKSIPTPCYIYDMELLNRTLDAVEASTAGRRVSVHYAMKANSEPNLLREVSRRGFGVDCVSIGEVRHALANGFTPGKIVYAGVGKTDAEIEEALRTGIACFNVESLEELSIINEIASRTGIRARVALRINPDIDAHTHQYITTGLAENKFGIDHRQLDEAVSQAMSLDMVDFIGLHFHIGSQILINEPFKELSARINKMTARVKEITGKWPEYINVGGGLGIDYDDPDSNPLSDFKGFFDTVVSGIRLDNPDALIHCELGRSIAAQCGTLLTRVIYVKEGMTKRFAIVDAGMNNLIRPALYGASHKIEKLGDTGTSEKEYDVVGPICESADCFAESLTLPELHRGDLLAIRSAGAYGQTMSSNYNMRADAPAVFY